MSMLEDFHKHYPSSTKERKDAFLTQCLLLFRTEATIYSEIMQSMKTATNQLNTPAWHRRHIFFPNC